jgi:hypothetical protein
MLKIRNLDTDELFSLAEAEAKCPKPQTFIDSPRFGVRLFG